MGGRECQFPIVGSETDVLGGVSGDNLYNFGKRLPLSSFVCFPEVDIIFRSKNTDNGTEVLFGRMIVILMATLGCCLFLVTKSQGANTLDKSLSLVRTMEPLRIASLVFSDTVIIFLLENVLRMFFQDGVARDRVRALFVAVSIYA